MRTLAFAASSGAAVAAIVAVIAVAGCSRESHDTSSPTSAPSAQPTSVAAPPAASAACPGDRPIGHVRCATVAQACTYEISVGVGAKADQPGAPTGPAKASETCRCDDYDHNGAPFWQCERGGGQRP
jgi:hypothetical protein